ncbi:MAG: hypothetical protein UW41_C0004G0019 [Candidatus Collierbacteria bacterium GW2011_GWC2_44_18]|uniref:Uncharacterized protein n=1 Tax=Candidatus Collierbacteria bacterium GW2011_GWC2_44_18 TaxID=1618392 RepID=A0A0G1HSH8_9BACT|nr:MAG: hypothetical protein UW41_C0004G0019 [Candidatus Collierbacteria bacterium GW2011_GWC2_44_18]
MRRIFLCIAIFTLLISCQTNPPPTLPATSISIVSTPLPTSTPDQTETPIERITVSTYGCFHTGVTFSSGNPASFECNLSTQEFTFAFAFGETVTASLFTSPEPVVAGQAVSITTYANLGDEKGVCVLTDSRTGTPLQTTLTLHEDLAIRSDCAVGDHQLTMAFTIEVIPATCVPTLVWESNIPGTFTLEQGYYYIIEAAFQNVIGDDAWWAHTTSWVEVNSDHPMTITGATGRIYRFEKNSCSEQDRLEWEIGNMTNFPNQLENFLHAGVIR